MDKLEELKRKRQSLVDEQTMVINNYCNLIGCKDCYYNRGSGEGCRSTDLSEKIFEIEDKIMDIEDNIPTEEEEESVFDDDSWSDDPELGCKG